jgi:AraC-like DNA-binding protein
MLLFMLYAAGATTAVIACVYLLVRRGNAFAPNVVTPVRLRRWTAAFFGALALGHLWYLPAVMVTSSEAVMLCMLIGALLDCMLVVPLAIIILLCMLQDRKRPLWPAFAAVAPLVILMVVSIVNHNNALLPWLNGYLLLLGICLTIYMVRAVRQYGRWLRDNYADLENKEVWQSFVVLAVVVLVFGIYASGVGGPAYEYIIQVCGILLICYLLWRVETLPLLAEPSTDDDCGESSLESIEEAPAEPEPSDPELATEADSSNLSPLASHPSPLASQKGSLDLSQIEQLLAEHCVDTKLYLQHDLTLQQLAQTIGINRFYLSQYFSRQSITYNTYINNLRINYFISRYQEVVKTQRAFTVQQLASESGYRSYSTFSLAFKQRMGQTVSTWMHDN